jgi:hypothetical protein
LLMRHSLMTSRSTGPRVALSRCCDRARRLTLVASSSSHASPSLRS